MTILTETLIVGLAAYRVWRLIGQDDITEPFRDWLNYTIQPLWPLQLVVCGWCAGTWISIGVAYGAASLGWVVSPPLLVGLAAAVLVGALSERLV